MVLINHGGTIVMHYIANSQRSVFDDLTPIVDTPGGKVSFHLFYRNLSRIKSHSILYLSLLDGAVFYEDETSTVAQVALIALQFMIYVTK